MLAFFETVPIFPDLAGKVALVTGSSRGIGATTAHYLARSGPKVVVNGRDHDALSRVVSSLQSSGAEVLGVIADCTSSNQIEKMRDEVEKRFGGLDLLLAFAGGGGPIQPIEDVSERDWNALIAANLTSKFLAVKSFLAGIKRNVRGRHRSYELERRSRNLPGCARLFKRASRSFHARQESCTAAWQDGIRVNAIAPSAIRNEQLERSVSKSEQEKLAMQFAIQRIGEPGDGAALFLCSHASSWITGITLDVAGGKVML